MTALALVAGTICCIEQDAFTAETNWEPGVQQETPGAPLTMLAGSTIAKAKAACLLHTECRFVASYVAAGPLM